jgi:hypothetical protein
MLKKANLWLSPLSSLAHLIIIALKIVIICHYIFAIGNCLWQLQRFIMFNGTLSLNNTSNLMLKTYSSPTNPQSILDNVQ